MHIRYNLSGYKIMISYSRPQYPNGCFWIWIFNPFGRIVALQVLFSPLVHHYSY